MGSFPETYIDVFDYILYSYIIYHVYYCLIFRVPGNSAAVTALQEELNNRGIENICLEEEVIYFEPSLPSCLYSAFI